MNLMTWLTGKTLAELVKKGQLIPPEIKLPVYPASHYKKNWYEQGIPHGGVIGLTAIMMTMTWIVSINMVIAQFELHNKKHLELVFFLAVGYIAFLTPSNQLLLKGRMIPLCAIAGHYFRYVGNVLYPVISIHGRVPRSAPAAV